MTAVGLAVVWAGYTIGLWGFCLVKGYDVSFYDLFSSNWPPGTKSTAKLEDKKQPSATMTKGDLD